MRERQKLIHKQIGVSLVEVLIVLVILTLGILTIIRLFPGGFETIRTVQNSTVADRIGEAAIQSLVQNNSALPDAILTGYTYASSYDNDLDGAIQNGYVPPATLTPDTSDPDNPKLLNDARYISNETMTVPSINSVGTSVYVVNYGPIDTMAQGFFVKGLPWTAESNDSTGTFLPSDLPGGQQTFAVDYVNKKIGFPTASYDQENVELSIDGGTTYYDLQSTADTTGHLLASDTGKWLDKTSLTTYPGAGMLPGISPAVAWTPGQVVFRRIFHAVNPTVDASMVSPFDGDPYEYQLPVTEAITSSATGVNPASIGAILFNPLAAGANGSKPLKAQISYTVYDWSIIHEDKDVPGSTSSSSPTGSPLRLSLNRLKENGYLQTNGQNYYGLIQGTKLLPNADVLVVDLGTGKLLGVSNISSINPGSGLVTLSSAYNGSRVRIYYAAENDWTVAMQKAPRTYLWKTTAIPVAATDSVPAITYEVDTTNKISYFPRCDAGKTIEIDGIPTSSGSTTSLTAALPQADKLNNYISLNLVSLVPNIGTLAATSATPPFTSVRGLSARAFVAYRERDGNYRRRTVDTVLARNP